MESDLFLTISHSHFHNSIYLFGLKWLFCISTPFIGMEAIEGLEQRLAQSTNT